MRIKRIVLDLHDVIITLFIQRRLFSLNMNSLFYLKLETHRGTCDLKYGNILLNTRCDNVQNSVGV